MEPLVAAAPWVSTGILYTGVNFLCQETIEPLSRGIWSDSQYLFSSPQRLIALMTSIIIVATTTIHFFLRPLRLPFFSQIIAGVTVGMMFHLGKDVFLSSPAVYIFRTLSFLGFQLHAFMLGVETSRTVLKAMGKKSIFVALVGVLTSMGLSFATSFSVRSSFPPLSSSPTMLSVFNVPTFFMVVCNHLNDLGISNSDLGQFAAAAALVLEIVATLMVFVASNVVIPLAQGGKLGFKPLFIIAYYLAIYLLFRPLIKYIVRLTPEGRPMKQTHFLLILLLVLAISFLGEVVEERFAIFMFAFTLPEEPLGSILNEKLDAINSSVFFPIFCALHGMKANFKSLTRTSQNVEIILLAGQVGKFFGTFIASIIFRFTFTHAIAIAILLSSKGLIDIAIIGLWRERFFMFTDEDYTVSLFHVLISACLFLPLVRFLYVPSRQYSTILRRSVIESCENGSFHALACIHKEESVPGLVHLLELCHPTRSNPLSAVALQLMQLTGRAALPFMAPLDQATSSSAFRSNLARCNRIVNAFLHFERENKGNTFIQHYVAICPYATMHNDICKLAYDKAINLVILPFHSRWNSYGNIEDSSLAIREVNTRVLEKVPCSVGLYIDRGLVAGSQSRSRAQAQPLAQHRDHDDVYRIAVLFVGGTDDQEALAYSRLLARNPRVMVIVVWFKGPQEDSFKGLDHDVMMQFRQKCHGNERISFREVVVNDGAETTQVVVSIKDVDLVIVGKHHDPKCSAVFGLCDGWGDFPELGIMGDMLASSDFRFSVVVVQHEPRSDSSSIDIFEDM